jgi:hypothetical protein
MAEDKKSEEKKSEQRNTKIEQGNYVEQVKGNYIQGDYVPLNKPLAKIFLVMSGLIALVGIVGIILSRPGNFAGFIFGSDIVVNQNDPKKIEQAKRLLASEIFTNINYIDNRLGFVAGSLLDGKIEGDLTEIQGKIATLIQDSSSVSYRRLIAQDQVASLRQAFNSRPLRIESGASLIQVLVDGEVNPDKVNTFYNQLTEVQDASESLIADLSEIAASTNIKSQEAKYDQHKLALAIAKLRNRSIIAYLNGITALKSLDTSSSNIQDKLSTLEYLEPKHQIEQSKVNDLLKEQLKEATLLASEREKLLGESQTALDNLLTIQDSDTWNVVVGKAISLRKRGQIEDAVNAFKRYGEMFSASDPTAEQYSRIAQQFTQQAEELNLEGGVYIYKVLEGDIAAQVGLAVGDIIIGYGSETIATVDDYTSAVESVSEGESVKITYLRIQEDGQLHQKNIVVPKGAIGAGLMPI